MRLNLGCGGRELDGYHNLDKRTGWTWESGLKDYSDSSVECVTSSHTLMYVSISDWSFIFSEVFRVLVPGGIWRITEDNMDDPRQDPSVRGRGTNTDPGMTRTYLEQVGFTVRDCRPDETHFTDASIVQSWYRERGQCVSYWIEGIKPCPAL